MPRKPGAANLPFEEESTIHEHPLFPTEEGEDPPAIAYITVTRWERGKQVSGVTMPAGELLTTEQIAEIYGGGEYILIGRKASVTYPGQAGNKVRQIKVNIPGKLRPMSTTPTEDEAAVAGAASLPSAAPVAAQPGSDGMTQLLMAMLSQQTQQAAAAQALAQTQSQQFMQMMVTMMGSGKSESAEMTKLMLQMNAQQSQNMMQMMATMMSARGGGPDEIAKYAQILDALRGKAGGGEGPSESGESMSSMIENVADIVTGIASMRGTPGAPTPTLPAPDGTPGSASSVLESLGVPR